MHAHASNEPVRRKVVWGGHARVAVALLCAMAMPSCSRAIRTGESPAYLILTSLQGDIAERA